MRIPYISELGARRERAESLSSSWAANWQWIALGAIVLLAVVLRFANLAELGDVNHYYTAAVKSMLQSWHNFFFVAAEPGGSVSVDKPPVGLWLETISAAIFGVNTLGVLLPELLAGILSVILVFHLVRRSFGPVAGLMAALALAITPVVVATDRNNTIDSTLILALLLAAWAFIKATETSRLRYLLLGAVLVGIGFNIKMLQAYLPLPAFLALYFLGAKEGLRKKIAKLGLAAGVLLVVSLSWVTIVDLTPASQRPYVGSSGDNSELSLAIGYNGLERLVGMGRTNGARFAGGNNFPRAGNGFQGNGFPGFPGQSNGGLRRNFGGGFTGGPNGNGQAGPLRLITGPLAREASWLLPFGLVGLLLLFLSRRWTWPLSSEQQGGVLWGGWLLTGMAFFSVAGFFHEYYLAMLGAPLAALVGIAIVEIWRISRKWFWLGALLLIGAAGVTLLLQNQIASSVLDPVAWQPLVIELFTLGGVVVLGAAMFKNTRVSKIGYGLVVAALLVTPGYWSWLTNRYATVNQSLPAAYSGFTNTPVNWGGLQVSQSLLSYLQANTQGMEYLMAVPSSMQGADYVIATGRPVLYMGGFMGADQVVTANDLQKLVSEGKLRYIYYQNAGFGRFNSQGGVSSWVENQCHVVTGFDTTTLNAGNPDGTGGFPGGMGPNGGPGAFGRGEQISLYDCGK